MRTAALLAAFSLAVAPTALGSPAAAGPAPAADPVALGGTPVEDPSTDPENRTELTAGLWSDTIGSGQAHQFSYRRTMDDSTVHVGVVGTSLADGSDGLEVASEFTASDGTTCSASESDSPSYAFPDAPFGAEIVFQGADRADRNSACLRASVVEFTVGRGSSSTTTDLPVAIKIVEEAPLDGLDQKLPAAPEEEPRLRVPDPAPADETSGAASFADAPLLGDGTVTDTGTEGATKLYRVSLDWDQTLALRLDVPAMDAALDEATGGFGVGPDVEITLFNPMRNSLDPHPEGDASGSLSADDAVRLTDAAGPVRYLSRFASSATYVPGDYWVAVAVEPPAEDADPVSFDYELTAEVRGEVAGEPSYESGDESFLVGDDAFSTVASGNPAPSSDDAAGNARRYAALGLGLLGLACCGLGALQLRRR
jgi:hypothetical protein